MASVIIKSLRPAGHYRAGRFLGPEEKVWPEGEFTPAELRMLVSDPWIVVTEAEESGPNEAGATGPEGDASPGPSLAPNPVPLVPRLAAVPVPVVDVKAFKAEPEPAPAPKPARAKKGKA